MAIQFRRGNYNDFKPTKMLEAEPAVITEGDPNSEDGTSFYICFGNGKVKRMATYEDMAKNVSDAYEKHGQDLSKAIEVANDWDEKYKPVLESAATKKYVDDSVSMETRSSWKYSFDDSYNTDVTDGYDDGDDGFHVGISGSDVEETLSDRICTNRWVFSAILSDIRKFMVDVKNYIKYLVDRTPIYYTYELGERNYNLSGFTFGSTKQVSGVSSSIPPKYEKYGKLVIVRVTDLDVGVRTSSWFDVCSGLPKAKSISGVTIPSATAGQAGLRVKIDKGSDRLRVVGGTDGARYHNVVLAYFTDED